MRVPRRLKRRLGDRLVLIGPRPHPDAIKEIAGASVLLAPLSLERSQGQGLSSKLFEYLGAGRPVIVINPTEADREVFSSVPGLEMLCSPSDAEVEDAIRRALVTDVNVLGSQRQFVAGHFRRDHQVARLAAMLDSLLADAERSGDWPAAAGSVHG
jgi:glycosyltransferase involved in cell wall biosynthesis